MPHCRGRAPVILCAPQMRSALRRWIEAGLPAVAVLSYNEVAQGISVESHGVIGVQEGG